MPELPEVETVARDLRPLVVGRRVEAVAAGAKALRRRWQREWGPALVGEVITAVRRRGKWLIFELSGGGALLVHLGMTGQLTVAPAGAEVTDHTHLRFRLGEPRGGADPAGPRELRFRDARRFGSVTFYPGAEALDAFLAERLGPEPFELSAREWRAALARSRRSLKAVLLDQRVVAGVGNIYADEALFAARLNPGRRGGEVTAAEAERLRRALARVLRRAIEHRGSTIRDYVGGSGQRGRFQDRFAVYGRAGEPCPRCGTPVAVRRLAGRSSHYCPKCQPGGG
ncbi:MAG TPA: bifunctional DNA-formamidopyrimidine glycosylase/DNA-(apurinic or apyrimidinic site) lyase [Gemmataceae bacterium]